MMVHEMTDAQIRAYSLNMWANHIETGDVTLSARDAQGMGRKSRALDPKQAEFVSRLRSLANDEIGAERLPAAQAPRQRG